MNLKHFVLISLLAVVSLAAHADDIDIYSGLGGTMNTPNIMFVIDNPSSQNNYVGPCFYWDGTSPSNGAKALGNDQCALANIVHGLTKRTDGSALINMGFTTMDGVILPLTPVDDNSYTGPAAVALGNTNFTVPAGSTNRQAIIIAVKALNETAGKSGQGTELQETWAYYTGGNDGTGNTGVGLLSGIRYPGSGATTGCQKSYIIYLSNVKAGASHAQDNGELPVLDSAAKNALNNGSITSTQFTIVDPLASGYTAIPNKPEQGWGIEWARFMANADINGAAAGVQAIVTYAVATGDTAVPPALITNTMEFYIRDVAVYGAGKYFAAGNDVNALISSILKILNEVQSVNSVFSSSSLPVSVNAQGTYLNQIYMGMFRPDPGAAPRWLGNLKQYQFIMDPTTKDLHLGDAIGNAAIASSGTGFLSPNAISFWTCTDLTNIPNPYLTVTPAQLTPQQIALLGANNQNCTDPPHGFWANDPSSITVVATSYDLPDGELVERGGAAQHTRLDNYETPPEPRHLYTWCPSGTGCVNNLTDPSNVFSTSNTGITADMFGTTIAVNISSLTRSGTTALVGTSGTHGFSTGDYITIANASPNDYNGTFPITKIDSTHFTYPVVEYPPTPASGTYTASESGIPINVTLLTRSGNTVTATTAVAHGFPSGVSVIIGGASPSDYNGSHIITVTGLNTFTYTVSERPPTVAGSGTASSITKLTGAGCPCTTTVSINAWNAFPPGVTRPLGSTTVTVNTNTNISTGANRFSVGSSVTISGVTDSSGASIPQYNGAFTITGVSGNSFTFTTSLSPTTPATIASGSSSITVSLPTVVRAITSLTRVGSTATATVPVHGFANGLAISIGGTPGTNENAYVGTFTISNVTTDTFDYTVVTTPATPATGVSGTTMTATRSTGFQASDMANLINWMRGVDNYGDEASLCPPGVTAGTANCPSPAITVRPSVHGDVLHSRPTVINYGSYSLAITGTSDSGTTRTATASAADVTALVASGATRVVTFANGQACPVTVDSATTFTYPSLNCGAAGPQTASYGSKVMLFYGDNTGIFHAANGNQTVKFGNINPGDEMWGFIPKEFFLKLNRLRTNSPQLNLPSTPAGILPKPQPKDYFVDGTTGLYQVIDGTGNTTRAIIYLSMRRGGRFIYAIDVTTPEVPVLLWRIDNTSPGMSELGQTWSQPKVAKVQGYCGGSPCSASNPQSPVLIFGAGYDANEDNEPPTTETTGRGIFVLDALTGALIWSATESAGPTSCTAGPPAHCAVSGMNYSIPADITLVDRDYDGFIDRMYAADVGGNIWRVDLEPQNNATPDFWRVHQLAALGCFSGPCPIPTSTTQRKFFYPPELIPATATHPYDAVIDGSGDREHPLYVSTSTQRNNRVFLLKDTYTGNDASGMTTPITMTGTLPLFDATTTPWDGSLNGYYITLDAGEKVVNAPLVAAGYVYFGTNQPAPPSPTTCNLNLGIAKGYQLSPFSGLHRNIIYDGGGLPPSPVAGIVDIVVNGMVQHVPFLIGGGNPSCVGPDCKSALGGQKPPINVSTKRTRTYWYLEGQ
jgi:type IV pilus assembly protein PilY1